MEERIEYARVAPEGYRAMLGLEHYVQQCGLESLLLELVKLRASQINGCAFCVEMHTKDARAAGESEQRLYAVAVWHEAPFFTERERAALGWTEAVTLLPTSHVPDDVYAHARQHFNEKELADLTLAIIAINGWNRLAVSSASPPAPISPVRRTNEPCRSQRLHARVCLWTSSRLHSRHFLRSGWT